MVCHEQTKNIIISSTMKRIILIGVFVVIINLVGVAKCTPASVNKGHERLDDGAFGGRDQHHYSDDNTHYGHFDHEAIIGSAKEAEEYDQLSPQESKRRLALLLLKMDLNNDRFIDKNELKAWILRSFSKLSEEEAADRLEEIDADNNGVVTWREYLLETYGLENEYRIPPDEDSSEETMISEDKLMFNGADENNDGVLNFEEFIVFSSPEEHPKMYNILINQTLKDKDLNNDGKIDFKEYVGDRGLDHDKEWIAVEKDKFDNDFDIDHDGLLSGKEIQGWIIPNNEDIAEDEVEHLFVSSDDDHDLRLSFAEILDHHDLFVGSEATNYGDHLVGSHFQDEL